MELLADDHPDVVETARAKLIESAERALPILKEAAASHKDPKVRVEAGGVLERIRLVSVEQEWQKATQKPDDEVDLEQSTFLLAQVPYPDIDAKTYQRRLDDLAGRLRPRIKSLPKTKDHLGAMNELLFGSEHFRGNWDDYFDPQNSYLNRVLDRKLGIPISLSVLYLFIARRLKIPVEGVGIPGHFMIKYEDNETELYVDTFNGGRFLSRAECIQFMVEAGYPYQSEFLDKVGPRDILARMLRNLILIYADRHEETLGRTLTHLLDLLYEEEKGKKGDKE
ncbi:MAG: hypothetical protein HYZ94_01105 [Candidatus Omnitrophica bacterium]|nr:hypothetical protein [Candidatus Omnitrophota bacterium]